MSGTREKPRERRSHSSNDKRGWDKDKEVVIIVEGQSIRSESSVLCKHSSVLKQRIKDVQKQRHAHKNTNGGELSGVDLCAEWLQGTEDQELRLEIDGLKYKDVKMTLCYLNMLDNKMEMTQKGALQILPVVEEFKLRSLKGKCDDVILTALTSKDEIHPFDLLEYIGKAEQFGLNRVRKFCMEHLASEYDSSTRQQVTEDKHIDDKVKLKILNKMFERLDKDYETNLKQIRSDMDKRCREIEKNRDEFMEQTEQWKVELGEKVKAVTESNEKEHKQLIDDGYEKELFKRLNATIVQFNYECAKELASLRFDTDAVIKSISELEDEETNASAERKMLISLLDDAWIKIAENTTMVKSSLENEIKMQLSPCALNETLESTLTENYELEDKLDQLSTILDEKTKLLTELDVKNAETGLQLEKTELELRKYAKRDHDLNTWVKWGKPENVNAERCTCFRHETQRKMVMDN